MTESPSITPPLEHKAQRLESVPCAVLTVSDSRTVETDQSGRTIQALLEDAGHSVTAYEILKDEPDDVRVWVMRLAERGRCRAILISGGTGLSPRDSSFEAVAGLFDKRLDGFGELFRMLSFAEIGPAAMLSRAVAGVYRSCAIFLMPGSTPAVRLAMEKLILPEIGHIAWLLQQA